MLFRHLLSGCAVAALATSAHAQFVPNPVRLNPADFTNREVSSFEITPDGQRVLMYGPLASSSRDDFFTSPINVFAPIQITSNPVQPGGEARVSGYAITPDGQRLIYAGDLLVDGRFDVYSASLTSSGTQTILSASGPATADASLFLPRVPVTPDSSRIVYYGDYDTDGVRDLYAASTTNPNTQTKLSPNLPGNGFVNLVTLSPDGQTVAFSAGTSGNFLAYSAPTDGSATATLLSPNAPGLNTFNFQFTPDSQTLILGGPVQTTGRTEVFSVQPGNAASFTRLNDDLQPFGFVNPNFVTADNQRVVFTGDAVVDNQFNLYTARIGQSGTQTQLNDTLAPFGDVSNPLLSPASAGNAVNQRVVYVADVDDEVHRLYSVRPDGSAVPIQLSIDRVDLPTDPPNNGGDVLSAGGTLRFTPDGSRIVYYGDLHTEGSFELYSASVITANSQRRLTSPGSNPNGDVEDFTISDDGQSVLYLADFDNTAFRENLYVASTSAENTQRQLTSLTGNADITDFALSADAAYAVYALATTAGDDDPNELWAVPTSAADANQAFQINGPIERGNTLGDFVIAPDGRTVLYQSSIDNNGFDFDLYSITLPALSLTGDYNADGFVSQADLDLVLLNWGDTSVPGTWLATEQFDGVQVSQNELDGVLLNWGNGTSPAATAIPEPASLTVLALSGLPLATRRRRSA